RSARSKRNAQLLNSHLGIITISHPFHPLQGHSFPLLSVKEVNGLRRYSLQTSSGVICVPETWINQQPESVLASQSLPFDILTLKDLSRFLRTLEDLPKQAANPVDNPKRKEVISYYGR
ncbi:DUF5372 family protein, partial [Paenibacillus koleovorans]|uniref:DUF5372 family protein n=1 Tax=Paenibacillus koleovorans TaxID=121608 RepID=UPI0013E3733D